MYSHSEGSSNTNTYISNTVGTSGIVKDTLHISPHIAAHKSSSTNVVTQHSSASSNYVNISTLPAQSALISQDLTSFKINSQQQTSNQQTRSSYQSLPNSGGRLISQTITSKECILANLSSSNIVSTGHKVGPLIASIPCVVPEDLSTATEAKPDSSSMQSNLDDSKPLPHIYTVAGQVPHGSFPGNTFYRSNDSPHMSGQPQAILVPCGDTLLDQTNNPTPLVAAVPSHWRCEFL